MSVKPEEFSSNVRKNKEVLKELAGFLTKHIQSRSQAPSGWDFRFVVIVAQWLVEQGRYTMTPEGNNPGNVVGKGDTGLSFKRPYNKEYNPKTGQLEPRPDVPFAFYSSMEIATTKKFDHLQKSWPSAYEAVLKGYSSDAYGNGLYPGWPKNYATAPQGEYVSGLRWRLNNHILPHYILTCEDDIKEIDQMALKIPSNPPTPGQSLDYRNDVQLNKNMRSVLENLLTELKALQKRVKDGKNIQP